MLSIFFAGKLVSDPVLRTVGDGARQVCNVRVVTRTSLKEGEGYHSEFIDVAVWGPRAQFVSQNFHKGSAIIIDGQIQQSKGFKRRNGEIGSSIEVETHDASFVPRDSQDSSESPDSEEDTPF